MLAFFVEKRTITYEGKSLSSLVFSTKKGLLSTHQSAIREAPTVFSRLPSLMAADKPCPLLQPSLVLITLCSKCTFESKAMKKE